MNLNSIILDILNEENVAGGPESALVSPDSTSISSVFSGPNVYNPGDNRRAKILYKGVMQKRPFLQGKKKRRKKK